MQKTAYRVRTQAHTQARIGLDLRRDAQAPSRQTTAGALHRGPAVATFAVEAPIPAGVGSGVVYDNQGHVLTNDHVVEGAQKLLVSLPDGRSFQAKLIGADPQTDLAVVQISGNNLPVAQLGDSSQLQVGTGSSPSGTRWPSPAGRP